MSQFNIDIIQGPISSLEEGFVNIIIDVVRAFTVSHHAFMNGAKEIILSNDVSEALRLKKKNKDIILTGEIFGLRIPSFDLGNSPAEVKDLDLTDRILLQKTTNGVAATLNALNADYVLVTGFSNAKATAGFVKRLLTDNNSEKMKINIIASHKSSDDDIACAEYIRDIICSNRGNKEDTVKRILNSEVSYKFLDESNHAFRKSDIDICIEECESNFVMRVYHDNLGRVYIRKYQHEN